VELKAKETEEQAMKVRQSLNLVPAKTAAEKQKKLE
jgi:hypothetical protein